MSRSEWIALAQALVSIAAIVIIYWQVHKQHKLHVQHLEQQRLDAEADEIDGYLVILENGKRLLRIAHEETATWDKAGQYRSNYRPALFDDVRDALGLYDPRRLGYAALILQHIGAGRAFAAGRDLVDRLVRYSLNSSEFATNSQWLREELMRMMMAMDLQAQPLRDRARELSDKI